MLLIGWKDHIFPSNYNTHNQFQGLLRKAFFLFITLLLQDPFLFEFSTSCSLVFRKNIVWRGFLLNRLPLRTTDLLWTCFCRCRTTLLTLNPITPRPSYGETICHSNFLICWQNPIVLPFKWNLFGRTFAQDYLFLRILRKEIWNFCWIFCFGHFRSERVKLPCHWHWLQLDYEFKFSQRNTRRLMFTQTKHRWEVSLF